MGRKILSLLLIALSLTAFRCSQTPTTLSEQSAQQQLDSFQTIWINYHKSGDHDSLILSTRLFFKRSSERDDTLSAAYSGLHIAQSFLYLEQGDSCLYYLDRVSAFIEKTGDPKIGILYHNIRGCYFLKYALDYPKALQHFLQGYESAKEGDSRDGMITMLSNIVYIFYVRSDRHGMEYARQAEALTDDESVEGFMKCYAHISMAQMLYLSGDHTEALRYADKAKHSAETLNMTSLASLISVVYADIYGALAQVGKADACYRHAIEYLQYTEPSIATLTLLKYGAFKKAQQSPAEAIELYRRGLAISLKYNNMEFRRELLYSLADLCYTSSDKNASLEYYREYLLHLSSVSNTSIEQDFSKLLLDHKQLKYDHEIQNNKLALLEANRKIVLFASILSVILLLAISLWVLYKRKQRMYKTLVILHQSYLNSLNYCAIAVTPESDDKMQEKSDSQRELFLKIEERMQKEQLYRRKELSLEMVAEELGSNRTYVSRAINTFTGTSFTAYVNAYRIREAARLLADMNNTLLFKQLADDLGYNSVTVFSKIFHRETGCTPRQYRRTLEGNR